MRTYKGGAVLDEFRGERIENNRWLVDVTMKDISAEDEDCQEDSKKLCLFGKNTFYESMCFGDLGEYKKNLFEKIQVDRVQSSQNALRVNQS